MAADDYIGYCVHRGMETLRPPSVFSESVNPFEVYDSPQSLIEWDSAGGFLAHFFRFFRVTTCFRAPARAGCFVVTYFP